MLNSNFVSPSLGQLSLQKRKRDEAEQEVSFFFRILQQLDFSCMENNFDSNFSGILFQTGHFIISQGETVTLYNKFLSSKLCLTTNIPINFHHNYEISASLIDLGSSNSHIDIIFCSRKGKILLVRIESDGSSTRSEHSILLNDEDNENITAIRLFGIFKFKLYLFVLIRH
jgi:hypothetical protein